MRGSDPRCGRVWGRQDVVNAELDLRLRFRGEGVWHGAWPRPAGVQRAKVRVRLGRARANCSRALFAGALGRPGRSLSRVAEADFHVAPTPAPSEVSVFKEVKHGFASCGKSPKVSFSLLVALRPGNLRCDSEIL